VQTGDAQRFGVLRRGRFAGIHAANATGRGGASRL
jgi:hypothetical protein